MSSPVTITIMVGTFPAVSQQFILNQIAALIDDGHEVRLLASAVSRSPDYGGVVERYRLMDRVRFASIPESPIRRIVVGALKLLKLMVLSPVRTLKALDVKRYRTAARGLKTLFYLDLLRREASIPLMHCHFGPMGLTGLFLKDVGLVNSLLVTFHGSDINSYPKRYGHDVYRALWAGADAFTANTTFTADRMRDHGCTERSIHILPVGLRVSEFPIREHVSDPSRFVILVVGRMVEKKGHRYMIEALSMLRDRVSGLSCWFVGDGPLRADLEALVRTRGLESTVTFYGSLPGSEVRSFYARCDVFALPSVTASSGDMEGQGLVLQEAQASGCPVVSTLHNGIPDGVRDNETGLLVPEKDAAALAEAILTFANDRGRIATMGGAAALFVRDRYDIARLNRELVEIYRAVAPEL